MKAVGNVFCRAGFMAEFTKFWALFWSHQILAEFLSNFGGVFVKFWRSFCQILAELRRYFGGVEAVFGGDLAGI